MNKKILMTGLAAFAIPFALAGKAHADAIPFFNVQYEATAVALTSDGTLGFASQAGMLGEDAVSQSASSLGATDISTAGAIVGPGLLSTSADVSAGALSSAVATSRFTGSFINGGGVSLSIDFTGLDFETGSGDASTSLFVQLTSNGVTLFQDYVQGLWTYSYTPLAGSTSVLDLTLTSDVSAAFLTPGTGNASSFGLVNVAGVVPENSTWLLFSLGLGGVVVLRARNRRAPARA